MYPPFHNVENKPKTSQNRQDISSVISDFKKKKLNYSN